MSISACLLCGADPDSRILALCAGCWADLPRLGAHCHRCAEPLAAGELCGRCARRPPPFTATVAAFRYRFPMDRLINALKFRVRLEVAPLLARGLAQAVRARGGPIPDLLVPAPMHRQRIAKRGYNQAIEIARALRNEFAMPVRTNLCSKTRATIPQLGLDAAARRRNLHGVFEAAASAQGLQIAIVDDVMTTGTTARELARVLRAAGAAGVVVWVAARA